VDAFTHCLTFQLRSVKELESCKAWKLQALKLTGNPLSSTPKEEMCGYSIRRPTEDEYQQALMTLPFVFIIPYILLNNSSTVALATVELVTTVAPFVWSFFLSIGGYVSSSLANSDPWSAFTGSRVECITLALLKLYLFSHKRTRNFAYCSVQPHKDADRS
jgi:hypothetical protein